MNNRRTLPLWWAVLVIQVAMPAFSQTPEPSGRCEPLKGGPGQEPSFEDSADSSSSWALRISPFGI